MCLLYQLYELFIVIEEEEKKGLGHYHVIDLCVCYSIVLQCKQAFFIRAGVVKMCQMTIILFIVSIDD